MDEISSSGYGKHPERPKAGSAHEPFITTTSGMPGFFAVMLWWNDEGEFGNSPFWEPWTTGIGRYATKEEAEIEGRQWAEAEEVEFKP